MRSIKAGVVFFLGCCSAQASGGAWCNSESGGAKIELNAGITRGMGGPVFNLEGKASVTDDKVPKDLRESTFAKDQLAQYWLDGSDLRFLLYRERQGDGEFGSVEVTITTKMTGEESSYAGTYILDIDDATIDGESQPMRFEGRIICSVE